MNGKPVKELVDEESLAWRCRKEWGELVTLQKEISSLCNALSLVYQGDQEGQLKRAFIERDELLITFGQQLLSICARGGTLSVEGGGLAESLTLTLQEKETASPPIERVKGKESSQSNQRERAHEAQPQFLKRDEIQRQTTEREVDEVEGRAVTQSKERERKREQIAEEIELALEKGISEQALEDFKEGFKARLSQAASATEEESQASKAEFASSYRRARDILESFGRPKKYSVEERRQQLILIEGEVENSKSWGAWPKELQHSMLTFVAARLRKIQMQLGDEALEEERLGRLFRGLSSFSHHFQPGFVYGLSKDKQPQRESWARDEEQAWQGLLALLPEKIRPKREPAQSKREPTEFTTLRALIRDKGGLDETQFATQLRDAVEACMTLIEARDPRMSELLSPHRSLLTGRRFKKVRDLLDLI